MVVEEGVHGVLAAQAIHADDAAAQTARELEVQAHLAALGERDVAELGLLGCADSYAIERVSVLVHADLELHFLGL